MHGIFDLDSPLMRGLSRLADLILLNLVAVVCAIPVVTLGASATALYYAMGHLIKDEGRPIRDFFSAFRSNFRQATVVWLILLISGALIAFAMYYYSSVEMTAATVLVVITGILLVVWCCLAVWAFPLLARYYSTTKQLFFNAGLLSLVYLPRTVLMVLINAVPVVVLLLFTPYFFIGGVLWMCLWFSLAAYLIRRLLEKPFQNIQDKQEVAEE